MTYPKYSQFLVHFMRFVALILVVGLTGCTANRLIRIRDGSEVTAKEIISEVQRPTVVFVGEFHDNSAHHRMQLDIIKALHATGRPMAIGLEMFTVQSQAALDAWVAGRMSTWEFKSVYKSNWKNLSWGLYKNIFFYARDNNIPLVGLNVSRGLIKKVSQNGLKALTEQERKLFAADTITCDSTGEEYYTFLKRIYQRHSGGSSSSFEYFCEAQVLWNSIMARHIVEYLKRHPHSSMVVLVGGGHARKKDGIPEAINRMSRQYDSVVITPYIQHLSNFPLNDIGDYLIVETYNPVLKTIGGF